MTFKDSKQTLLRNSKMKSSPGGRFGIARVGGGAMLEKERII